MDRADAYAQRLVSEPHHTDEIFEEIDDWVEARYGFIAMRNSLRADYERIRLKRYIGLTAFFSVTEMLTAQGIEAVDATSPENRTDAIAEMTAGESPALGFMLMRSAPGMEFAQLGVRTLLKNRRAALQQTTDAVQPYAVLCSKVTGMQPEFRNARWRYEGIEVANDIDAFIPAVSEENMTGVLRTVIAGAMVAPVGMASPAEQAAFVRRHSLSLGISASVNRLVQCQLRGAPTGHTALEAEPLLAEYEAALETGRPLDGELNIVTHSNDDLVYRHRALQDGPMAPHRFCVGFPFLNGPDGVRRSAVDVSIHLGALLAEYTVFSHWPGVRDLKHDS